MIQMSGLTLSVFESVAIVISFVASIYPITMSIFFFVHLVNWNLNMTLLTMLMMIHIVDYMFIARLLLLEFNSLRYKIQMHLIFVGQMVYPISFPFQVCD